MPVIPEWQCGGQFCKLGHMRSREVNSFINEHAALFWFIPEGKKTGISDDCLVETVLNYGDVDAVRKLVELMGLKTVARTFVSSINTSSRRRNNYNDLSLHYFELVFRRYAPECFNG